MNKVILNVVDANGERIDKWISNNDTTLSRSAVQNLIENNKVLINNKIANKKDKVLVGDTICICKQEEKTLEIVPQEYPLKIVYEDNYLLVVNKDKGIVVHPATSHTENTLVNYLKFHCNGNLSDINGDYRSGIVHRIDKNTSGLLIVAKTNEAHEKLAVQIKNHSFERYYEGVVYGRLKQDSGVIDEPVGRSTRDRKKMTVTEENSKNAITHFNVIKEYKEFTHVRFQLETGRTHQIRVHMAYVHHPIAGDDVYGPKKVMKKLMGQCLHAKAIGFVHPITNEYMFFESELPPYFTNFLNGLR